MSLESVDQLPTETEHIPPEMRESQLNAASELMDLLHIDVETEAEDGRTRRDDAPCSVGSPIKP